MIHSKHSSLIRLLQFLAASVLPLTSVQAMGQAPMNLTGSTNCQSADFDINLQFTNGPEDYYSVVIIKTNISDHPCRLDGPMYGPSVVPDRASGQRPYELCYYCDERLPDGRVPVVSPITIRPGQAVRQTFRWETSSLSEPQRCFQPQWMADPVLIVAPTLLKEVCSPIAVSRFSVDKSSDATGASQPGGEHDPPFELRSDKNSYAEEEPFSLRVSDRSINSESSAESDCPLLYLRVRSPDGTIRIDEVHALGFRGCGPPVPGHQLGDWRSGFDLDSGANSRWMGSGQFDFEVLRLHGSPDAPQLRFDRSNTLQIQVVDPATVVRKWGTKVRGVATDISLDGNTFTVGEDIHLHLAVENFDAKVPIYMFDPVWDPCGIVGIEVQDEAGRQVSAADRFIPWSICTGHGRGPQPITKGKVIPLERTLGREGWLPNRPGIYKIVVTWVPCFGARDSGSVPSNTRRLKPYAIARASAKIRIVNTNQVWHQMRNSGIVD